MDKELSSVFVYANLPRRTRSRSGSRVTARNRKPGRVARFPTRLSLHGARRIGFARQARPLSELRPGPIPRAAQFPAWLSEVFGPGPEGGCVLQALPLCRLSPTFA